MLHLSCCNLKQIWNNLTGLQSRYIFTTLNLFRVSLFLVWNIYPPICIYTGRDIEHARITPRCMQLVTCLHLNTFVYELCMVEVGSHSNVGATPMVPTFISLLVIISSLNRFCIVIRVFKGGHISSCYVWWHIGTYISYPSFFPRISLLQAGITHIWRLTLA